MIIIPVFEEKITIVVGLFLKKRRQGFFSLSVWTEKMMRLVIC